MASTSGSSDISMRCSSWSGPTDMRVTLRTEIGGADGGGIEAKILFGPGIAARRYSTIRIRESAGEARQVRGEKTLWNCGSIRAAHPAAVAGHGRGRFDARGHGRH